MRINIESIGKILPIGGTFILLCSSLKLVLFYKQFNIKIADYIELSEYITVFIDDLIYYCTIFGFGLIFTYILNLKKETSFTPEKHKKEGFFDYKTLIIVPIIILGLLTSLFFIEKEISSKLIIVKMGTILIYSAVHVIVSNKKWEFSYNVIILVCIIIYSSFDGLIDSYKLMEKGNSESYKIILEKEEIKTNKNILYLGKTNKYIFTYNIELKESKIVLMKNLKSIKIKESILN
ncbi:MAG: hypothetical protein AB8B61_06210 [Cyclobacteriaceae bacterium]